MKSINNNANSNKPAKRVIQFGTALSTLTLTPHLEAAIVDLSGSFTGSLAFASASFTAGIGFNLVGTSFGPTDLRFYNDLIGNDFFVTGNISGIVPVAYGAPITNGLSFAGNISQGAGTATFGFLTDANQTGWIKILRDSGGPNGPTVFLAAAFNDTPGEGILAGTLTGISAVPEPNAAILSGLVMLSAGAVSRRRRKKPVSQLAS